MADNFIKTKMKERGISQKELASFIGFHEQDLSEALNGKRNFPIDAAIKIERILFMEPGKIEREQSERKISKALTKSKLTKYEKDRNLLLKTIKAKGGFWSYEGIPEKISDDDIIEEGLQRLEFEDMYILFDIWSEQHIKRIWKERLLSQGKRLNILNTLLQLVIFS